MDLQTRIDMILDQMMREEYQRWGWEAFLEEDEVAGKRSGKRGKSRRRRR